MATPRRRVRNSPSRATLTPRRKMRPGMGGPNPGQQKRRPGYGPQDSPVFGRTQAPQVPRIAEMLRALGAEAPVGGFGFSQQQRRTIAPELEAIQRALHQEGNQTFSANPNASVAQNIRGWEQALGLDRPGLHLGQVPDQRQQAFGQAVGSYQPPGSNFGPPPPPPGGGHPGPGRFLQHQPQGYQGDFGPPPPGHPGSEQFLQQQQGHQGNFGPPPPPNQGPTNFQQQVFHPQQGPPGGQQGPPPSQPAPTPYAHWQPPQNFQVPGWNQAVQGYYNEIPQQPAYLSGQGVAEQQAYMNALRNNLAGLQSQYGQVAPQVNQQLARLGTDYGVQRSQLAGQYADNGIFESGIARSGFQNQVTDYNRQQQDLMQAAQAQLANLYGQAGGQFGNTQANLLDLYRQEAAQAAANPYTPYGGGPRRRKR